VGPAQFHGLQRLYGGRRVTAGSQPGGPKKQSLTGKRKALYASGIPLGVETQKKKIGKPALQRTKHIVKCRGEEKFTHGLRRKTRPVNAEKENGGERKRPTAVHNGGKKKGEKKRKGAIPTGFPYQLSEGRKQGEGSFAESGGKEEGKGGFSTWRSTAGTKKKLTCRSDQGFTKQIDADRREKKNSLT